VIISNTGPISHGFRDMVSFPFNFLFPFLTLPYFTSEVGRLLHLLSAEVVLARPNARPRM